MRGTDSTESGVPHVGETQVVDVREVDVGDIDLTPEAPDASTRRLAAPPPLPPLPVPAQAERDAAPSSSSSRR